MSVERSQDLLQPAPRAGARRRLGDEEDLERAIDPGERRLAAAIRARRTDPFALVGWLHGVMPLERPAVRLLVLRELGAERGARVLSQAFGTHEHVARRATLATARTQPERTVEQAPLDADAGRAHTIADSVVRLLADRDAQAPADALTLIESLEPSLRPLVGAELRRRRLSSTGATAEEALARRTNGHAAAVLAGHALPKGVRFPVHGPLGRRDGTVSRWLDRTTELARPKVGGRIESTLDRGGRTLGRLAQRVVGDALGARAVGELRAFADAAADRLTKPAPARAVALDRNVSGHGLSRSDEQVLSRPDGERLPLELEQRLGALLGHDFSHVRIHTDDAAAGTAERLGANALTVGSHIFFNRSAYRPGTAAGDRLLVHELTHVVQHDEGRLARSGSGFQVTSPSDHVEREAKAAESKASNLAGVPVAAPRAAATKAVVPSAPEPLRPKLAQPRAPELGESVAGDWKSNLSSAWDATTGAVTSTAEWAGHKVVQGTEAVGELAEGAAESLFEKIAPEWMVEFVKDPAGYIVKKLKALIESGISALTSRFSGVMSLGKSLLELASAFETAFEVMASTGKNQQACCTEFAAALNTIKSFATKLMHNPATAAVKSAFQALDAGISWLVRVLGGAVFDFFKEAIPAVWQEIESFRDSITSIIGQLGQAKDWLLDKLAGLGLDLRGGTGGVLDWVEKQLAPLWAQIKQAFSIDNLKKAAMAIVAVSPLGPILYLTSHFGEVASAVEQVVELWQHRNDPAFLKNAQNTSGLKSKLLLLFNANGGLLEKLMSGLQAAGKFIADVVGFAANAYKVSAEQELSGLGRALGVILSTISGWLTSLVEWGEKTLTPAFDKVQSIVTSGWHLVQPYAEVLGNIATVIAFPPALAGFVVGTFWQHLEPCIKEPIVDLLLDVAIDFAKSTPELMIFGPMWSLMRRGFIGFLTKVRSNPKRVALFDGIAKMFASPVLAVTAFVKGFLTGVIDNVMFPFQAIAGAFKVLVWVSGLLSKLGEQSASPRPPGAKVAVAAQRGTSVDQVAAEGGQQTQMPQAPEGVEGQHEAAPAQAGGESGGGLGFLDGMGEKLLEIGRSLKASFDEFIDATKGGLVEAVRGAFKSQGGGMSFSSIVDGFGALWGKVLDKVESMSGEIADKLVEGFASGGAETAISTVVYWIGYVVGTIVFQVVIDALTAGSYTFIGPVVAGLARFINLPAELLGPAFKLLGKFGGLLPAFVKDVGAGLGKGAFGFIEKAIAPLDKFGKSIVTDADKLAAMWSKAGQKEGANAAESFGVKSGLVRRTAKVAEPAESMVAHKAEQLGFGSGEKAAGETAGKTTGETAGKTTGETGDKAAGNVAEKRAGGGAEDDALRQKHDDLDKLYAEAEAVHPKLAEATRQIADDVGGKAMVPDALKSNDRAVQKIASDYGGDASRIVDLSRSTIVCEREEQVYKALEEIKSRYNVVRMKDRIAKPVGGYRDILLNVEIDGHVVEMQLHLDKVLEVKNGAGHKLYEQIQKIERLAKEENRALTAEELKRLEELKAQSQQVYDDAYAKTRVPKEEPTAKLGDQAPANAVAGTVDHSAAIDAARTRVKTLKESGETDRNIFHGTSSDTLDGLEDTEGKLVSAQELSDRGVAQRTGEGDAFSGKAGHKKSISVGEGEAGLGTATAYGDVAATLRNYNVELYTEAELKNEIEQLRNIVDKYDDLDVQLMDRLKRSKAQFASRLDRLESELKFRETLPPGSPRRMGGKSSSYPVLFEMDRTGMDVKSVYRKGPSLAGEAEVKGAIDLKQSLRRVYTPAENVAATEARLKVLLGRDDVEVLPMESLDAAGDKAAESRSATLGDLGVEQDYFDGARTAYGNAAAGDGKVGVMDTLVAIQDHTFQRESAAVLRAQSGVLSPDVIDGLAQLARTDKIVVTSPSRGWVDRELTAEDAVRAMSEGGAGDMKFVRGLPEPRPIVEPPAAPMGERAADAATTNEPVAAADGATRQPHGDLDKLYADAEAVHPKLAAATQQIADDVGGRAMVPEKLKGRDRAVEKIASDYGGDASRLVDLSRSTIVCQREEQVYKALEEIKSRYNVVRIKDRIAKPVGGYRDILLNVEIDGHIVEMQLHLEAVLEAKSGPGHALYEEIRTLEAKAATENRALTAEEVEKLESLKQQSQSLYDDAYAKTREPVASDKAPADDGVTRQKHDDLDKLYADAEAVHPKLAEATRQIADDVGGKAMVPDVLKSRERAAQKIASDYGGDAGRIVDLSRSTIVCEREEQVYKALEEIKSRYNVVRMKDRIAKPVGGYRDILLNVEIDGHVVEMQLHLDKVLEVKNGAGHKLYEQIQKIERLAKEENRALTAEELEKLKSLKEQSQQVYDDAYAKTRLPEGVKTAATDATKDAAVADGAKDAAVADGAKDAAVAGGNEQARALLGDFEGRTRMGSCKVTCDSLQKDVYLRTGERVNVMGVMPSTHFHVRTADGTIIDPTIMQFFNGPVDDVGEIFVGNDAELIAFIEQKRATLGFRAPMFDSCPSAQALYDTAWKPATVYQDGRGLVKMEAEDEDDEAFVLFDRTKVPKEAPKPAVAAEKPVAATPSAPPPAAPEHELGAVGSKAPKTGMSAAREAAEAAHVEYSFDQVVNGDGITEQALRITPLAAADGGSKLNQFAYSMDRNMGVKVVYRPDGQGFAASFNPGTKTLTVSENALRSGVPTNVEAHEVRHAFLGASPAGDNASIFEANIHADSTAPITGAAKDDEYAHFMSVEEVSTYGDQTRVMLGELRRVATKGDAAAIADAKKLLARRAELGDMIVTGVDGSMERASSAITSAPEAVKFAPQTDKAVQAGVARGNVGVVASIPADGQTISIVLAGRTYTDLLAKGAAGRAELMAALTERVQVLSSTAKSAKDGFARIRSLLDSHVDGAAWTKEELAALGDAGTNLSAAVRGPETMVPTTGSRVIDRASITGKPESNALGALDDAKGADAAHAPESSPPAATNLRRSTIEREQSEAQARIASPEMQARYAEPADMKATVEKVEADMRATVARNPDGTPTNFYDKLMSDTSLDAAGKDRVVRAMSRTTEHYAEVGGTGKAADAAYQEVNRKHTLGEIDQVLDACRTMKLSGVQTEDALLSSIFSDSHKVAGLQSLLTHNQDGADAAAVYLARELGTSDEAMARIARIRAYTKEHQIGPPGFMSKMVGAHYVNIKAAAAGKPLFVTPAADVTTAAERETLASVQKKIADPLNLTYRNAAHDAIEFTPDEQKLLDEMGIHEWPVPQDAASHAVVAGDSAINYASPEGTAKIVSIRGPNTGFRDKTIQESIQSAYDSAADARTVLHEPLRDGYDAKVQATKGAVARVETQMEEWLRSLGRDPAKTPFWRETPLDYTDVEQVKFATELRAKMDGLLRDQQSTYVELADENASAGTAAVGAASLDKGAAEAAPAATKPALDGLPSGATTTNEVMAHSTTSGSPATAYQRTVVPAMGKTEALGLVSKNVQGLSPEQADFLFSETWKRNPEASIVFGGSRVRGGARVVDGVVVSDMDVGFVGLTKQQVGKVKDRFNKAFGSSGHDIIEHNWIFAGSETGNIPGIVSPEEFFLRSGTRESGAGFGPSGYLRVNPDYSLEVGRGAEADGAGGAAGGVGVVAPKPDLENDAESAT